MSALHRSRAVSSLVAVLMLTLAAPIAVHADDEVLVEEPVLAAQDQDPALAPAAPVMFPAQVSPDVRWAPGPAWLAASRAAAARRVAPAFPAWGAARWSPLPLCEATNRDSMPAQLASGQRAESAHLATVPLPGQDTGDGALAVC
jgi:hypothetical protein